MNEPWPGYNQALAEGRITIQGVNPDALFGKAPVDDSADEKGFQAEVVKFAQKHGWKCYHTYNSRKSAAGFPDLVLVRDAIIFAELKTATGKFSAEQLNWQDALDAAGAEWYGWRPADWPKIAERLARPRRSSESAKAAAGLSPDRP